MLITFIVAAVIVALVLVRRPVVFGAAMIVVALSVRTAVTIAAYGTPREGLIGITLAAACVTFLIFRHKRAPRAWLLGPWLLYILYNLPYTLWFAANGQLPYTWVAWALTPGLLYLVIIEAGSDARAALTLRRVLIGMVLGSIALALFAFVKTGGVSTLAQQLSSGAFDAETLRFNAWRYLDESRSNEMNPWLLWVNGAFEHGASLALVCALLVPQTIWHARFESSSTRKRLFATTVLILLGMIGLSFERGAWVAMVLGFLVLVPLTRGGRQWFMRGLFIALILLSIGPVRNAVTTRLLSQGSVGSRLEIYGPAMRVWMESPIVGVGFGNFNNRVEVAGRDAINPHNDFLLHLAETGVLGLALYFCLFAWTLAHFMKAYRATGHFATRAAAAAGFSSIVVYLAYVATGPGQICMDVLLITLGTTEAYVRFQLRLERVG